MQRLYRIIIYILIVVCCQSELKSQTFILGVDIKEQLWHYLYQRKEVLDSLPPFHTEPLYYESNGIVVNNNYIEIRNLITRVPITKNEDLEEIGLYSFKILYKHPETKYIFLKYREELEILYFPVLGIEDYLERYDAMLETQLQQLIDYFKKHPDIDKHLLSVYATKICAIYDWNTKHLE